MLACLFPCHCSAVVSRDLRLAPGLSAAGFAEETLTLPSSPRSVSAVVKSVSVSTSTAATPPVYDGGDVSPGPIDAALQAICRGPKGPAPGSAENGGGDGDGGCRNGSAGAGAASRRLMLPEAVVLLTRLGGPRCETVVREEVEGGNSRRGGNKTPTPPQQQLRAREGAAVGETEAGGWKGLFRRDENNATSLEGEEEDNSPPAVRSGEAVETENTWEKNAMECPAACPEQDDSLEEHEASAAAVATACRLRRFWNHSTAASAAVAVVASEQNESCSGLARGSTGDKPPNSAITSTATTTTTVGGATVAILPRKRTVLLHVCSGPGSILAVRQVLAEESRKTRVSVFHALNVGEQGGVSDVHRKNCGGGGGSGGGGTENEGIGCRLGGTTVAALGSLRRHGAYCVVELGFPNTAVDGGDDYGAGGGSNGGKEGEGERSGVGAPGGLGWFVVSIKFGRVDVPRMDGGETAGGERLAVRLTAVDSD